MSHPQCAEYVDREVSTAEPQRTWHLPKANCESRGARCSSWLRCWVCGAVIFKSIGWLLLVGFLLIVAPAGFLRALADSPYPKPKNDGRELIQRTGSCPTGYVGRGNFCEALHSDTPRAYLKIKGAACPSGTFASGDYCKSFR